MVDRKIHDHIISKATKCTTVVAPPLCCLCKNRKLESSHISRQIICFCFKRATIPWPNYLSSMKNDKFNYEFGGPAGALVTMICLPLLTLLLTYWASVGRIDLENILPEKVCLSDVNSLSSIVGKFKASNVLCPSCTEPPVLVACAFVILIWFLFQAVSVSLS